MQREVRAILSASCGYAAAIIGAGFASGQEIVSFFVRYGKNGIIGIVIACVVFSLFSYAVMSVCTVNGIHSYNNFLEIVLPRRYMVRITETAVLMCSAASMCVMTACAGELGRIVAGVPEIAGAALFTVVCGIIFFLDGRRIMGINSALGAVIIFGIIFSCFYILRFREHQTVSVNVSVTLSGLSYAGYNLVSTGALLAGMSRFMSGKGNAAVSSAVTGVILCIMITLIWGVLGIYYGKINLGEIPMLTMAFRQNNLFGLFYGIMLMLAVLTTGISNGFAVIDMLGGILPKKYAAVLILLLGFCMSGAGFSRLVNTLYRFCGCGGAVIVFIIIIRSLILLKKEKMKEKKSK